MPLEKLDENRREKSISSCSNGFSIFPTKNLSASLLPANDRTVWRASKFARSIFYTAFEKLSAEHLPKKGERFVLSPSRDTCEIGKKNIERVFYCPNIFWP